MTKLVELSQRIGKTLLIWSIASIIIGIVLLFSFQFTLYGGIGLQAIIWGIIDAAIAAFILFKQKVQSVEQIGKTVSINIYLDIIYQVVGVIVIVIYFQNPYLMGNGIGVIIQGFFLLLLDRYYHNSLRNLEERN
ncbi:MAG: hypothetical protein RTV31_04495 [Candidatus Thorarchaeota archaeon]